MANTITFPPVSGGGGGGTGDAAWGSITGVLNTQVDLRNALNGKQAALVSGTNIKTIDGQDILGSGDLDIAGEYYKKTEVDNLISTIPETDLSNYYSKTEVYNKLESYSKDEVDSLISSGGVDLSDYYTKTQVDSLIPDISTKQDTLVSATNIKTINGESILGSGDLVIPGGGAVDLSEYYKKTETYSKAEVDSIIADIPATDLSGYYDKTETETLLLNKVDKEVGKGLSTNDFTDTFKQALELNKVQNITTNSDTKKLVVTYTDGTFVDLNLDDVVTDVKVEGAILDSTTNVLTILSRDGGYRCNC